MLVVTGRFRYLVERLRLEVSSGPMSARCKHLYSRIPGRKRDHHRSGRRMARHAVWVCSANEDSRKPTAALRSGAAVDQYNSTLNEWEASKAAFEREEAARCNLSGPRHV